MALLEKHSLVLLFHHSIIVAGIMWWVFWRVEVQIPSSYILMVYRWQVTSCQPMDGILDGVASGRILRSARTMVAQRASIGIIRLMSLRFTKQLLPLHKSRPITCSASPRVSMPNASSVTARVRIGD